MDEPAEATLSGSAAYDHLAGIRSSLQPRVMRERALAELDEMFRTGSSPSPAPDGMLRGELITTSVAPPADAAGRAVASLYMPWLGKSFDSPAAQGVNVLKPSATKAMKVLWPGYQPERELADRIEAFPFHTRIAPGAVDPQVEVLKIDYDIPANPDFVVRRILDELVQVDDGLYLGKILFRTKRGWRPIGFFSLSK